MRQGLRGLAGVVVCLLGLAPAAALGETRPIEGHENWKLGMTLGEALAAEPRAERRDCDGTACLHYADQRFASAEIDVSARFNDAERLDLIVVTMAVQPGDNRCLRLAAQLAAFYTAAHGETLPLSSETWVWSSPQANLTLLRNCRIGQEGMINILFEAVAQTKG